MVEKYAAGYPGLKIAMGEPLGIDERLADILADRIRG
jgi:sirohydrochlorin ferrochelatase